MTVDLENGMTFAMSIWSSQGLDWLQHGRCEGQCGQPELQFKNFVFKTASYIVDGDNSDNDDEEEDDDGENESEEESEEEEESGEEEEENDEQHIDISAGFAAIRNNPHYSTTDLSRTLYQVDQSFDYIEKVLVKMGNALAPLQN